MDIANTLRARSTLADLVFEDEKVTVLSAHIGFFILWYSVAENFLTTALALVLDQPSIPKFTIIAKGMDARVKVHRLREACRMFAPMGPNMDGRLDHFERRCIDIRNHLVHSWPILEDDGQIHLMQGARRPPRHVATSDTLDHDKFSPAKAIPLDQLLEWGVWLNLFAQDVGGAIEQLEKRKAFEVDDPLSKMPEKPLPSSQRKFPPTKRRGPKRNRSSA